MPPLALQPMLGESWWDCGLASAQCVLLFHGITTEAAREAVCGYGDPERGTSPAELASIFLAARFGVIAHERMTLELMRENAELGYPTICSVTFPETGGHWVVFAGQHAAGDDVSFMDPFGGPRWLGESSWLSCWQDETTDGPKLVRFGLVAIPGKKPGE